MDNLASHNPLAEWLADSNEALCLRLVSASEATDPDVRARAAEFHPAFSYPVFGDEEKVFGFKGLRIKLYYAAGSLFTYLGFNYSARIGEGPSKRVAPGVQPQDVVRMISEKLPKSGITHNYDEFAKRAVSDEQSFCPMGTKIHEYTHNDKTYEMYECTFETAKFREYHRRLQTFLLWFIEGASYLQEDDHAWQFILLFEKSTNTGSPVYKIVGYLSYYPFYNYPDKKRMRISQFIILPPFQKQGHGGRLYRAVINRFISDPVVSDITVEDPNDAFQDMRDKCDVERLLDSGALKGCSLPLQRSQVMQLCSDFKLCKRQAFRCAEIVLLSRIPQHDNKLMRLYRLYVKARIYRQNREVLESMDYDERLDKLHSTFSALLVDYRNILNAIGV